MAMATERIEKLANYLAADTEKAKMLVEMDPAEAIEKINADGFDFTVDELKEFAEQMQAVASAQSEQGELSADALDNVAGGVVISSAVLAAGVALFTAGVTFGYTVARDRGW